MLITFIQIITSKLVSVTQKVHPIMKISCMLEHERIVKQSAVVCVIVRLYVSTISDVIYLKVPTYVFQIVLYTYD